MREEIQSKINEVAFMCTNELNSLKRSIALSDIEAEERGALIDAITAREIEIKRLKDKFADNGELKGD